MKWSIPLDRLAEKAKVRLEVVARRATAHVYRSVVQMSPVDTGHFRANWNASYGTPDYTTTSSTDQGRGLGEAVKPLPVGGITYLSNGLPYALRLEYGWSKQAPAGMVRLAAMQFNNAVKAALK